MVTTSGSLGGQICTKIHFVTDKEALLPLVKVQLSPGPSLRLVHQGLMCLSTCLPV